MSQVMAGYIRGRQQATPTASSTTVETRLNGNTPLETPAEARKIIALVPQAAPNAALTAAETGFFKFDMRSNAIKDLSPKEIDVTGAHGGLGTFVSSMVPAVKAFPVNIPTFGNEAVSYYATAYVTNTAEFDCAVDVLCDNRPPNKVKEPQVYYQGSTNETSTGTAAADGVAGGTFSVNANKQAILRYLQTTIGVGTVTASESYIYSGYITSNGISTGMPVVSMGQWVSVALGTALSVLQPQVSLDDFWIPIKNNALVSTFFNQQEAKTAAGNWHIMIGFMRDPIVA